MGTLLELPTRNREGQFHVVVESPQGYRVKLKYDGELGAFTLARPLALGLAYPFDWGFVPSTLSPDGDPLDAMVILGQATAPGVVMTCRALGVVQVEQDHPRGGRIRNDRVIAVPTKAPRFTEIRDASHLTERQRAEIEHFFESAVLLENKNLKLLGWGDAAQADELIDDCCKKWLRRHAE